MEKFFDYSSLPLGGLQKIAGEKCVHQECDPFGLPDWCGYILTQNFPFLKASFETKQRKIYIREA
jgi:hypothetical protein